MRADILPRLIRARDAPAYLGMDREVFGAKVRPHLTVIPIGAQGRSDAFLFFGLSPRY